MSGRCKPVRLSTYPCPMSQGSFEIICEVEPATRPDLTHVRHQIGVLSRVADRFLIPDNHIGRATVSSIAVAHEVELMGGQAIACINARDRNTLGFQRDLLTAAAYGVKEFLFVYGDRPETGKRSDDLKVKTMIQEARHFQTRMENDQNLNLGVTAGIAPLPQWKLEADLLFAQVSFSFEALMEWRASISFNGAVFAGVMVIPSPTMARKLSAEIPQLAVPPHVIEQLDRGREVGVEVACDLISQIRDSGAFDGVHLIPTSRYREVAARLEATT